MEEYDTDPGFAEDPPDLPKPAHESGPDDVDAELVSALFGCAPQEAEAVIEQVAKRLDATT
jgi:hypothetical protein